MYLEVINNSKTAINFQCQNSTFILFVFNTQILK
jgi:hypothetical protein